MGFAATTCAVRSAASSKDKTVQAHQYCDAGFFIAELKIAEKATTDAKRGLKEAIANCPKESIQIQAAQQEMKKLGG